MEIDVSIRNATLGELQQLFGKVPAMQGDRPKFRISSEATPGIIINIAKALKTEADKILGDAKDLDLTPPTPKKGAPVVPEKKPAPKPHPNSRAGDPNWLTKEVDVIKDCKNPSDAWDAYKTAFPGQRNRNAIDQKFRKEALVNYQEKYPDSKRSADAIGRRFYDLHPDKRNPVWSVIEKQPILSAGCVEDAIADYQKHFPESNRTVPAIRREWFELRPEKRGEIPTGRKNGGTNKGPLKGTAREKYKIPFSTTQNPKGYNHAVYICTKYDKPYEEAVKLEEADLKAKKEKKADKIVKIPKKPPVKKDRLPFHQNQKPDPAVDEWPDDDHDIVIEGIDGLVDKMPDERPPGARDPGVVYHNPRNPAVIPAIPAELKIGVHVKQIKPYLDRKVSGIGVVTARVNGLVEVNFSGTQYYKIAPDCLEVL
jgi:hypothetical protein